MNILAKQANPLSEARTRLQAVLLEFQKSDPRGADTASLARMLTHMDNIEKSVTASTADHVNASKRLNDFANTIERLAKQGSDTASQTLGELTRGLVQALRAASAELGNTASPPSWAAAKVDA